MVKRNISGGVKAQRGFIFQSIIAIIQCLERDDWDSIKLEPETENDKVDIRLYKDGKALFSIQVKSSINPFKKSDVKKWLQGVRDDAKGEGEILLYLVGDFFEDACRKYISDNRRNVETVSLENLDAIFLNALIQYIKKVDLGKKVKVDDIELIDASIFSEIHRNSIAVGAVSRGKFEDAFQRALPMGNQTLVIKPSKNKNYRDQYKNNWNKPLFLTDSSTNRICLRDIYVPLCYKKCEENSSLMDELLKKGGHLVLGHPGIGKSALISWILNKSVDERIDQALVYRMARFDFSSYKDSSLPASTIMQEQTGADGNYLRNRVVFLDGFDECALNGDERERFLGELSSDWDDIEGLTWVITCRLNYISDWALKRLTQYSHYTLLPFNEGQIETFIEKYSLAFLECNKSCGNVFFIEASKGVKNLNNKDVLGIPLILYMVSALQIQVRDDSSLVQIYDQIFDRENKNSIYCKVYDNHGRNEKVFEKRYLIHQVSRDIALWMFCNNASEALIDGSSYKIIEKEIEAREIQKKQEKESVLDNLHAIGSYIIQLTREIRHIEGENEICFVHRTMFEYFLVEGFVEKAMDEIKKAEDYNSATNNLSSIISTYFYATEMTINMESYLKEKLEQKKTDLMYKEWEMACLQILKRGVCEFVKDIKGSSVYKTRRYEAIIFKNICILLQVIKEITCFKEAIFDNVMGCYEDVSSAIRHSSAEGIKLCLNNFMLKGANLQGTYLCDYKFRKAILCGARMSGANLKNADLQKADLSHADLCEVDLNNASLSGVIFDKTKITDVKVGWRQVAAIKESGFGKCNFSSIIYENKVYKSKKSFLEEIGKKTTKNANKG